MFHFPFSRPLRNPFAVHRVASGERRSTQAGFSLIELLVVTAIITVISGLVLVNNSRFGGVIRLESLAYDIALSVRQAQVYGIAVARFSSSTYTAGYGVRFDKSTPNQYLFYGDSNNSGLYDSSELLKTTLIAGGYTVSQLCATTTTLGVDSEDCTKNTIDILFLRPEPDGIFSSNGTSCYPNSCFTSVRVVLLSPRGDLMSVIVDNNGQISVRNS